MTFCLLSFAGPILCKKMLECMVQWFDGVVFATAAIPSDDMFYVYTRPYGSHSVFNYVFANALIGFACVATSVSGVLSLLLVFLPTFWRLWFVDSLVF